MHFQPLCSGAGLRQLLRRAPIALMAFSLAASAPVAVTATEVQPPFTVNGMKQSIRPGDDFNGYVNGGWIDSTAIPADRSHWGIDGQIAEETDKRVAKLIEDAAKGRRFLCVIHG
jgi:predicted metalloendopeptidase